MTSDTLLKVIGFFALSLFIVIVVSIIATIVGFLLSLIIPVAIVFTVLWLIYVVIVQEPAEVSGASSADGDDK